MERAGLDGILDINISKTDITKTDNDAIVNSISKDFRFSGAIAKAIKKKCGDTICHECVANGQEKYEHGLSEGSVIRTGGGKSGFKAIYHIVLGSYRKNSTEQKIKDILLELLEDANNSGIKSIGIPPFGTGDEELFPFIFFSLKIY